MAGIPKRIRVLGVPYSVTVAPHGDMGCTNVEAQTITVQQGLGPEQERKTTLHEALHALLEACGLRAWLGDSEEGFVSVLEGPLFQLLRDNPRLVGYLCER